MRPSDSTNSIDRLAFVAVGISVLAITWNGFRLAGGAVANAFLALAIVMVVLRTAALRKPIPFPPWMFAAAIGFALAAMLTVIITPDTALVDKTLVHYRTIPQALRPTGPLFLKPRPDLVTLFQFLFGLIAIPILIASVATTAFRVRRLLDLFVWSAAINAAVGVVDWAGFRIAPIQAGVGRSAGLTIHPNYLALTCTVAIPLALLWIGRGGRWRMAGYGATGLLLMGALASGSRVGAVTAVLGVVATMIAIPRLRSGIGVTIPAAGIALVALAFFAGDQILQQVRLSGDVGTAVNTAGSDTQRSQLAHLALQQFSSRPLNGVGYSVIADAHSIYLQLLAAGGVIALASFLTYMWGLAREAMRAMRGPQRDIAIAASVSISMWLINGILDNQLGDKYLWVVPGILLATSYVTANAAEQEEPSAVSDREQTSRPLEPAPVAG